MKEALLTYQGFNNLKYCFKDQSGKEFHFVKAKNELVWSFELNSSINIGKKYKARYFVNSEKFKDNYILCDLEDISS